METAAHSSASTRHSRSSAFFVCSGAGHTVPGNASGSSALHQLAPNAGAHRLAWWLAFDQPGRSTVLARGGVPGSLVPRILDGQVIPEERMAAAIAIATAGDVLPEDWAAEPGLLWTTAPTRRTT